MKKISYIFIGLLLPILTNSAIAQNSKNKKPNILLIMVDDLNTYVNCFDGPAITPNMDGLAAEGIAFKNAYCVSPSCNPSRTAMLTGLRPENTGIFSNSITFRETPNSKDLVTLPGLLKKQGYNTIGSGKIFHARRGNKPEPNPHSDPESWTFQADIDGGLFFGKNFKKNFLDDKGVPKWVSRATGKPSTPEDKKIIKSTWSYGPIYVEPTNTLDFNSAEFCAAYLNKDMSDPEVAKAPPADEKPFFLACGIFRPHIPILAPKEFFDLYEQPENKHRLELPNIPQDDLEDLPPTPRKNSQWFVKYLKENKEEQKRLRHAYYAASSYADAAVGIVLDGLKKSGLADNTIVILAGDHGYQLGEKDRVGKSAVWRGSSRMPLIIKMPKGVANAAVNEPVSLLDIYPTLMELTGITSEHDLDGVSLVPLLQNPKAKKETPAVITSASTKNASIGVVKHNWHYISYYNGDEELYNHEVDPKEIQNLLAPEKTSKKYRKIADELKAFVPKNRN